MNKEKRQKLRQLAKELLLEYKDQLQFYKSLNFDDKTKADAVTHVLAIEFKHSNIERLKYEIEKLQDFRRDYLHPPGKD